MGVTFAAFAVLALFWVLLIWLRQVERGRVHRTLLGPLIVSVRRVEIEIGEALLPAFRKMAAAFAEWQRTVGPAAVAALREQERRR